MCQYVWVVCSPHPDLLWRKQVFLIGELLLAYEQFWLLPQFVLYYRKSEHDFFTFTASYAVLLPNEDSWKANEMYKYGDVTNLFNTKPPSSQKQSANSWKLQDCLQYTNRNQWNQICRNCMKSLKSVWKKNLICNFNTHGQMTYLFTSGKFVCSRGAADCRECYASCPGHVRNRRPADWPGLQNKEHELNFFVRYVHSFWNTSTCLELAGPRFSPSSHMPSDLRLRCLVSGLFLSHKYRG